MARTDARGIRTCYQYDALHRITEKTYSDGTPSVVLMYGTTDVWGWPQSNTTGRLSLEATVNPSSGAGIAGSAFSYDALGRTVRHGACTPATCGWGGFDLLYGYDLADDLIQDEMTEGSRTLNQTFDLAGRPLSLASSSAGTLISSIAYNARGQELSAALGNGNTEARGYDPRGRLTSLTEVTAQH
ncbi:MAG: hypothetical protein ACRDKL_02705, partial [Solirubrobacteraceae bacterium]